jgi:hypothetical protein
MARFFSIYPLPVLLLVFFFLLSVIIVVVVTQDARVVFVKEEKELECMRLAWVDDYFLFTRSIFVSFFSVLYFTLESKLA